MPKVLITHLINKPWVRYLAFALALVTLIVFAQNAARMMSRVGGNDFTSYLQSADALISGSDPYHTDSPFPYIYPLFLAMILAPLLFFPAALVHSMWFVISLGSLVYVTQAMLRHSYIGEVSFGSTGTITLGIICLLPLLNPIQNTFSNGQVNLLVLGCMVGFLFTYLSDRQHMAALLLGLVIAIKLVPAILLVFLLVRGSWKVALGATSVAMFAVLLPYLVVDDRLFVMYNQYLNEFLLGSLTGDRPNGQLTYSIAGLIDATFPQEWPRIIPKMIGTGFCAIALGFVEAIARRKRLIRITGGHLEVPVFSAYALVILLLSPLSETHHLVFIIPAWLTLVVPFLLQDKNRFIGEGFLLATFLICFLTAGLLKSGPIYFAAIVLLGVGLVMQMSRLRT